MKLLLKTSTLVALSVAAMISCGSDDKPAPTPTLKPAIEVSFIESSDTSITASFTPNIDASGYAYAIGSLADIEAFDAGTIPGYSTRSENQTITFEGLTPSTGYTIFAQARAEDGTKSKIEMVQCRTGSSSSVDSPRNVGYLTTWDYQHILNNVDWSALTHINIAFCNPDSAGNLKVTDWNDQTLQSVVNKAHSYGVKVLPSIRNGEASLFATAQSRTDFINKIMAYVERFGFDGFDIDLEKSEASFWTNYEKFLVELRARFDEKGLLLTTAVSTWFSNNITDKTFACFDFINIMAYDLGRPNHSTFEAMKRMAEHYKNERGIPAKKIVCGVPFYGYNKTTPSDNYSDYKSYKDLIAMSTSAADVDEWNNYTYNGRSTMRRKCEFAQDYGGIMIWTLNYDTTDQYSLLRVIRDNLFEGAAPRPVMN